MLRSVIRSGLVAALALCALSQTRADQKEAEEALKSKGLTRRSTNFCIAEEMDLAKLISGRTSEAGKRKKLVDDAQTRAVAAKKACDDLENSRRQCRQEWDTLNVQLQTLSNGSPQYNKMVDRMNLLAALGKAVPARLQQAEKTLQESRLAAATQRENFIQYVVQLRQKYDALVERYRQLGEDPAIKKALDDYGQATSRICALGPQKITTETIRKLEGEVLSDEIPIYPAGGNLWHVFITVNGKEPPLEIAIDTGASMISLPFKDAQTVGLSPTSQTRQMTVSLADGRTIQAYHMKADSVRVGKFTVKNVDCSVMPADCPEAAPLLGLSFLNNFNFKIDKTRGLLIMATIEDKEKGKRTAATTRGEKAGAAEKSAPADPAMSDPVVAESQTPAEKLAKLLTLDGMDAGSRKGTLTLRRRGGADLVFRPCKRGPAKTLQERFGDPDEMRKFADPHATDEDARKALTWKLWTWGPVLVLVDETGTTRYFAVDKEEKQ